MTVAPENEHYFNGFKTGDQTNKGTIDDLFFLQFTSGAGAFKTYEPNGKGLCMARINKKDYVIGDLKITLK